MRLFQTEFVTRLVVLLRTDSLNALIADRENTFELIPKLRVVLGGQQRQLTQLCLHQTIDFRLNVLALKDLATDRVHDAAMSIDDVVILNDVFTNIKVVTLDTFLRRFKGLGHHAVLNRHIVIDTNPVHDRSNTITLEDTH